MRSRPLPVTVAAILLALFSVLWDLTFPLWAQAIPREEETPVVIVYLTVLMGAAGLVGAAGLWMLRKWGLWLAIVVSVLNLLDGASGVAGAPYPALQFVSTVIVVVFTLIIVLVVLPSSRRALAVAEQPSRVR
jgi:uncharacterized membrane protein (DUF2068 family)